LQSCATSSRARCDELAKWRHAEATFDMLPFGLRLGQRPRRVVTTTPRPIALNKRMMDKSFACAIDALVGALAVRTLGARDKPRVERFIRLG
jgi:phage terminase large subunit-like protein